MCESKPNYAELPVLIGVMFFLFLKPSLFAAHRNVDTGRIHLFRRHGGKCAQQFAKRAAFRMQHYLSFILCRLQCPPCKIRESIGQVWRILIMVGNAVYTGLWDCPFPYPASSDQKGDTNFAGVILFYIYWTQIKLWIAWVCTFLHWSPAWSISLYPHDQQQILKWLHQRHQVYFQRWNIGPIRQRFIRIMN